MLARDRDVVGGAELVRVADGEQRDARRLRDQLERRLEDRHARRLRADERARDLEPLLGEQLVEVVARDAARDLRIAGADLVGVRVGERAEPLGDRVRRAGAAAPDAQPLAAVRQHLELHEVVRDARAGPVELGLHRVPAARVVAEHAAERAVGVRGRVRPEGQPVLLARGVAEVVEDAARLHARDAALGVDLEDVVEVLREVDQHRRVAALAGEARAPAAQDDRRPVLAADAVDLDELVHVARDDDADRRHPVVRGVGRVEGAAAGVEPDLALDRGAEVAGDASTVEVLRSPHREAQRVTSATCALKRAASRCLSSSPLPGRERSGRRTPSSGSGTPSKTIPSTRTWSWKYSRCRRRSTAQNACVEIAGAQWAETSIECAFARPDAREEASDPAAARDVGLEAVDAADEVPEVGRDVGVLAGRDHEPGRPRVADQRAGPARSSEETGSSNHVTFQASA